MIMQRVYIVYGSRLLRTADHKLRPISGRRVINSDEDVDSPPGTRNPEALPSPTSQPFFDASSAWKFRGEGSRRGESPIELSSDSEVDSIVQTAPRTRPRSR
jgi:hypothetical protein